MRLAFVIPPPNVGGDVADRAFDLGRRLVARGHSVEIVPFIAGHPGALPPRRQEADALVLFPGPVRAGERDLPASMDRIVRVVIADSRRPGSLPESGLTLVFETQEERARFDRVARRPRSSEVIGAGVEVAPEAGESEVLLALKGLGAYLFLAGPLEARDGYAVTVDAFLRAEREGRTPVTLVLVGRGRMSLGENVHVRQLGELSDAARDQAIRGALAALVPSRREALAPSALLAWRLGRPVIAHGPSEVMRGLLGRANGGIVCERGEELAAALELLRTEPALGHALGRQGRDYLEAHHAWPVVLEKWESLLARVAAGGAAA